MRTRILIFLLAGLTGTSALAQDMSAGADDQQQYQSADVQFRQTDAELAQQQQALNDLLARQSGSQALATSLTDANIARQSLYDAREQLYTASSNEAVFEQVVTDKQAAFDAAKAQADRAAQAVEDYRKAAIAQFEASPAMKNATAQLESAQRQYQQAIASADDWLRGTYEYAEKYCAMQNAVEIVRAERAMNPPDPKALADASQQWVDAQSALESFYERAIQSDLGIAPASARVDAASQARQSLVDQFNRDLANDPAYKQLADSASSAASAASSAAADVNTAQSQLDQDRQQIAQLQSIISAQDAELAQAESAIAAYPDGGNFAVEVGVYQSRIDQLCDARFFAWRRREFYDRRLHGWDHRSRLVFHDGNRRDRDRDRDRDFHGDGRDRNHDNDHGGRDQHPESNGGGGFVTAQPVVPYGPQPVKRVVPYGPQPSKPVVPYGPQPIASPGNVESARTRAPRSSHDERPAADQKREASPPRQGPEPVRRDEPRRDEPKRNAPPRVVAPYGPEPKSPAKSPDLSHERSTPQPPRDRTGPAPEKSRSSPSPSREPARSASPSPSPQRDSHNDRPARAPTPRYDSPSPSPSPSRSPPRDHGSSHDSPSPRSPSPSHDSPSPRNDSPRSDSGSSHNSGGSSHSDSGSSRGSSGSSGRGGGGGGGGGSHKK
jgi:hypothetical protein